MEMLRSRIQGDVGNRGADYDATAKVRSSEAPDEERDPGTPDPSVNHTSHGLDQNNNRTRSNEAVKFNVKAKLHETA